MTDEEHIIAFRRELHRYPELSHREDGTLARIARELNSLGIPHEDVPGGGMIARVGGGNGPRLALRADVDALPVTEKTGLPFASENPGVAHVCGHDAHAAAALGAAADLSRSRIAGTVYFCFQRAEEVMGGAKELVARLRSLGGVDMAAGFHLVPGKTRTIRISDGAQNAGSTAWRAEMRGAGGHGSSPWLARDPIRPMSELVLRMTAMNQYAFPRAEPFVVSPCRFTSGDADNVIPASAELVGTTRYFRPEQRDVLVERLTSLARTIGESYGVEGIFTVKSDCPPVVNTPEDASLARNVASELGYAAETGAPEMWSDNISEYIAAFGGFFAHISATPPEREPSMLHSPDYTVDENAMINAARFFTRFALTFCGER